MVAGAGFEPAMVAYETTDLDHLSNLLNKINLESKAGIEPSAIMVLQTIVFPLHHLDKLGRPGRN